jgi:hypothetical protein
MSNKLFWVGLALMILGMGYDFKLSEGAMGAGLALYIMSAILESKGL